MRDQCPLHLLHMAANMIFIIAPYVADFPTYVGSMVGGETHCMSVSYGEEDSLTFYSTCSDGSMGDVVATIIQ